MQISILYPSTRGNTMTISDYQDPREAYQKYLDDINKYPVLTAEENLRLLSKYHGEKNEDVRNEIILGNQRLVVSIAYRFCYGNRDRFMENISVGNIGLIKAIDSFDETKGCAFSTHAYYCIRGKIGESRNSFQKQQACVSLSTETEEDQGLLETIEDKTTIPLEIRVENIIDREKILQILAEYLTQDEQYVIMKRFGFDGDVHTLQEIANMLGIKIYQVSAMLERALVKLRSHRTGALERIKLLK